MSQNLNLKIYKASAGSGKTHTIVCEYLKIALKSPNYFNEILAVTFTNKVTRELKHRIVETIQAISRGEINPIATEILLEKIWSKEELITRAKMLLRAILQDYTAFEICTIDSFFQKIIDKFDIELNLKPGFAIELDINEAKKAVLSSILNKIKTDKYLKNWLLEFTEEKLKEGKSWEIEKDLSTICTTLFIENKLLTEKTLEPAIITNFIKKLNQEISDFEKSLQNLGKIAIETIKSENLKIEDFAYGKSGVMGYLEKISTLQIENPTIRTLAALKASENWISKKCERKKIIQALVEKSLLPLLEDFMFFYNEKSTLYKTAKSTKKFIYILGIRSEMQRQIENYKKNHNILFIPDATLLTYKAIQSHSQKEFSEKFNHEYRNFFIDEFQDISSLQWECFNPLIKNSVAKNNCSIIVGDVKQSIYRWRNSDWQLLHEKIAADIPDSDTINLTANWRSLENIILFNNTFFSIAPLIIETSLQETVAEIENMYLRNQLSLKIKSLAKIYDTATQHIPNPTNKKSGGYLEVHFLENDKESDTSWQEEAINQTLTIIEDLQTDGFEAKDIAILVRNHKEGCQIFEAILRRSTSDQRKENCNYSVVSASSSSLGQNASINLILSAMKYIYNSEDSLARYETLHFLKISSINGNFYSNEISSLNNTLVNKENLSTLDSRFRGNDMLITEDIFEKNFLKKIRKLHSYPLHILVDALIDIFEIKNASNMPFFQKLKDIIIDFEKRDTSLKNFLLWWEEKGRHTVLSEQSDINAIKILTIHQSKGLQFKATLMPFCDWDFDHSAIHAPMLWCKAETEADLFTEAPLLPMFYSPRLKETFFAKSFYDEQMQSFLDNLNLLYVALTRAEECMYIFSQKSCTDGLKSIADLLRATLLQKKIPDKDFLFSNWEQFWNEEKNVLKIGEKKPRYIKSANQSLCGITENGNLGDTKSSAINLINNSKSLAIDSHHGGYPRSIQQKLGSSKRQFDLLDPGLREEDSGEDESSDANLREKIIHQKQNDWISLFESKKSKFSSTETLLGDLVHNLIAQMNYLKDLPKILQKIDFLQITEMEKSQLRDIIINFSNNSEIKTWFDSSWTHKIEMPLITKDGKILRPDRVLIKNEKIIVLDFKTGLESQGHHKQIKEYMDALAFMYPCEINGYILYLTINNAKIFQVKNI